MACRPRFCAYTQRLAWIFLLVAARAGRCLSHGRCSPAQSAVQAAQRVPTLSSGNTSIPDNWFDLVANALLPAARAGEASTALSALQSRGRTHRQLTRTWRPNGFSTQDLSRILESVDGVEEAMPSLPLLSQHAQDLELADFDQIPASKTPHADFVVAEVDDIKQEVEVHRAWLGEISADLSGVRDESHRILRLSGDRNVQEALVQAVEAAELREQERHREVQRLQQRLSLLEKELAWEQRSRAKPGAASGAEADTTITVTVTEMDATKVLQEQQGSDATEPLQSKDSDTILGLRANAITEAGSERNDVEATSGAPGIEVKLPRLTTREWSGRLSNRWKCGWSEGVHCVGGVRCRRGWKCGWSALSLGGDSTNPAGEDSCASTSPQINLDLQGARGGVSSLCYSLQGGGRSAADTLYLTKPSLYKGHSFGAGLSTADTLYLTKPFYTLLNPKPNATITKLNPVSIFKLNPLSIWESHSELDARQQTLGGMHAYIHTCMHACMHAYIHTYIHTYIETVIRSCFSLGPRSSSALQPAELERSRNILSRALAPDVAYGAVATE